MRKFFPPPNMNYYKGSVQTEPDQDLREEKHDFRQQKSQVATEEDELPRSRYIPAKPKSLSINTTPRLNGIRALQFTPNNEIIKPGQAQYKSIHRPVQSESLNPFDIFMKRFNQLQHNSEIPNPEPVKHSEKSYGTIKAFGICTNQGLIRTYNEDRVSIILNIVKPDEPKAPPCSIFSLFDGHGGSKCADFLRNNLHNNIVKSRHFPWNLQDALREAFEETEKLFIEEALVNPSGIYEKSGSCALVMVIIEDTCYICNLGDSRAVMSQNFGKSVYALTRDHKPNDKQEQKRIMAAGGRIYQNPSPPAEQFLALDVDIALQKTAPPFRILPGKLSVSRAFGDIEAKLPQLGGNPNVLIAKPEITKLKLNENHDFILLGCDGIFDRLSNEEVVHSIWETVNKKQASSIHEMTGITAENTIRAALLSKSFDNVTAILVTFANFETAFNQKKDTQTKSIARLEPSLMITKSNLKSPTGIVGLSITNSLNKSNQFNLANFSGPERLHSLKKDPQLYEPIFEKKEEAKLEKAEFASKRLLPNINKMAKRGPTPQTNYK